MRIAIITFSDFNTNYGSMLQSFALKTYLEKQNHEVVFIKYREFNNLYKDMRLSVMLKTRMKSSLLDLYKLIKKRDIQKTVINFEKFKKDYFIYTPLYTSNEELKDKLPDFDCYICGSDQIWNINCLGGLRKPYFLDFVPNNKKTIAYAPSMGDFILNDKYKNEFIHLLNNLDYISMREKSNIEQIQRLTNKKLEYVCDPVYLLSKEEWENFLPKLEIKKPFGVCYFVRRSKFGKMIVKKLTKKYNIPIINLSDNLIYINGTSSKYISAGPLEFLTMINDSSFTIGTSFHLAAFSIIFNKPFLVCGIDSNKNRINNILELTKTKNNFITSDNYLSGINSLFEQKICYKELIKLINQSKDYLRRSIKE